MRRTLFVLLVALALIAAAVAALAPASLVAARVERATGGAFAVRDVDGTLWRGRGVLTAGDARVPLAWTLDAMPLLTGELHARLAPFDASGTSPRAEISAARQRVTLRDVDITMPAGLWMQVIARGVPRRGGWTAEGDVTVTASSFDWRPPESAGDLAMVWRHAQLVQSALGPVELGELTATLAANGDTVTGPVGNRGGELDIHGDITVRANGSAALSLLLTPRLADDAVLARMLGAIGTAEGSGWRVNWQSTAP